MKPVTRQQITDLYCDLAAHLLSIPQVQQLGDEVVMWLSERVLLGLPNKEAYNRRPRIMYTPYHDVWGAIGSFTYPDTSNNNVVTFLRYMLLTCINLEELHLPRFARHLELANLCNETGAPR